LRRRQIDEANLTAKLVGKDLRYFFAREGLRTSQGIGLAYVAIFSQSLHCNCRHITNIYMADSTIAFASIKRALSVNSWRIVVNHVLHKSVGPKKRVGNAGRLDVVLGLGMLPRKYCFAPAHR